MPKRNAALPSPVQTMSAADARTWWKSLMANACALIIDSDLLARYGSVGRARSLVVLGMEELAKAKWLYDAGSYEWSRPLGLWGRAPAPAGDVQIPVQLTITRLPHTEKIGTAEQYAAELPRFWGRWDEYILPRNLDAFEAAAEQRNLDKQAGFYVDRVDSVISSPLDIPDDGIDRLIEHAAQVLEMHLIEDHTRRQEARTPDLIDSSQDLHMDILHLAHPEEFAAAYGSPNQPGRGPEEID